MDRVIDGRVGTTEPLKTLEQALNVMQMEKGMERPKVREEIQVKLKMLKKSGEDVEVDESGKREVRKIILEAGSIVLASVTKVPDPEELYKEALSDLAITTGGEDVSPVPSYIVSERLSKWASGIEGYYAKRGADAANTLYVNQNNGNSQTTYLFAVKDDRSSKIIWMIHENPTFRNAQKGRSHASHTPTKTSRIPDHRKRDGKVESTAKPQR